MPLVLLLLLLPLQDYTQRGFIETQATIYPQAADNDDGRAIGQARVRYEGFYKPGANLQIAAAAEWRADTHRQAARDMRLDWKDRSTQRPMLSLRRLSAQYHTGEVTIEAGKQFIRWGKTDIVNPTDRFAPRDFLTVVDNEFLGVTAVRATWERGANTVDAIWSPRLTPSRIPLPSQRWSRALASPAPAILQDIPGGSQTGLRWSHTGAIEFSGAYYDGFHHVPSFAPAATAFAVEEFYPRMRMFGGDFAAPLPWLSVKAEAGYFTSPDVRADEYVLYVVQLERQAGEWFIVGGYGGESRTKRGTAPAEFNPDRGMIHTLLARATYTIDTNRSVAFDAAVRENGDGAWVRAEYSQAFGQHWRLTAGTSLIRGEASDFLGQYRRNSHVLAAVKYSF